MKPDKKTSQIELSYLTKQLCIIMKMPHAQIDEVDVDMLQSLSVRIKKKLEDEKTAGHIDRYMLSTETLIRAWPILKKKLAALDNDERLAIRIAFGVRKFDQVRISSPEDDDSYCELTIDASAEEIKQWNIVALSSYVKDFVQRKGWSSGTPDRKSLKTACDEAIKHPGEQIQILKNQAEGDIDLVKITSDAPTDAPSISPPSFKATYRGHGYLQLKADPDRLGARIINFSNRWYDNPDITVDEAWLMNELQRLGVKGETKDFIPRIKQKMDRKQDLNGLQVAVGIPPTAGKSPYLAAANHNEDPSKTLYACEKGAIIGEIRYKIAGIPGKDVFDKLIEPPMGESLDVELGDGVERVNPFTFRATQGGLVKIDGSRISVAKTYVCEGDFTSNSGLLDFKGNIIITGNVESGTVVTASGDIQVEGSVRGAAIFCGGNLTVKGGLSTTQNASIRCNGDLKAGFVERARIFCKKNIFVDTAIVQSEIYCGNNLTVLSGDGLVGASRLYVWGDLTVSKLGFATGAPTYIHLGEDWKEARRSHILRIRMNHLNDCLVKDKSEEQTLKKMKSSKLTKKRLEQKQDLEAHIQRLKLITKALEARLERLAATRKLNTAAKLKTSFAAAGDVEITLVGEPYNTAKAA